MNTTTNTAGEALDLNKSRAEFEAWATEADYENLGGEYAGPGNIGWWYWDCMTAAAWDAWQAALARAGTAAPTGQQAEPVATAYIAAEARDMLKLGRGVTINVSPEMSGPWTVPIYLAAPAAAIEQTDPNQFRKKPVVIEAIQWTGGNFDQVASFAGPGNSDAQQTLDGMKIYTLEGTMSAAVGDWIIRGIKGELYPCKPDIFAATYEPIAAQPKDTTDTRRDA